MTVQMIQHVPSVILTAPTKTIQQFDKRLEHLVNDLKDTLATTANPKGVGLAAVQIGQAYRVFVTRPTDKSVIRVFVNPRIIKKSKSQTEGVPGRENKLEGCLSIPKIWGKVHRSDTITLWYQDEKGSVHQETFNGFMATIIQHETDHTNGVLFTQRVLEQKGKLYQAHLDKDGKEKLEEFDLK